MTTARRLPGGEVVILWEAQVSPLGLHSKQWLAHRNEFLPETKSKSISKVPKSGNMQRCTKALPSGIRPTASAIEDVSVVLGCVRTLHGCPLAPAVQVIDVHFNFRVWPVLSAAQGSLPCRCRITCHSVRLGFNALPNIDNTERWRGWSSAGVWTLNQSIHL